jgi:ubiquinone/menaquinone biosynthesis C-methylase UbiE
MDSISVGRVQAWAADIIHDKYHIGKDAMSDSPQPKIWKTKTYDRLSKYYDKFMRLFFPIGEKGRESIVERLKTGSVLDVGCGTGTLLALASLKELRCFGVDLSGGMLGQAKIKVPNASLTRGSFYKLPFPSECFDDVVATNALSGTYIDTKGVLVEMIRVCKKGGSVHIAEWPVAQKDSVGERIIVELAKLSDDAPKDYLKIFRELDLKPEVEPLDERYYVFSVRKV